MEFDFSFLGPDRLGDWAHAVERWELGDPQAVADFVRRYGVEGDVEREGVARMLTTKPDPRRIVKPSTKAMLRDLDRMLRQRDEIERVHLPAIAAWVARLRRRLASHGMSDVEIDALLRRRRPGYLRPKKPSLDDIYVVLAQRHRVSDDAIRKLHKRHRR